MAAKLCPTLLLHRDKKKTKKKEKKFGRATEKRWRCFAVNAHRV